MLRRYKLKNYNFRLVILLIAISIIGVLLIGSADRQCRPEKQAIGVVLGVVIMIIVSLLDYSWLLNFYWVLYIGNLMMLGVLYRRFYRKNTFGATRWIQIGSFSFQFHRPSCQNLSDHVFAMFLMKHEDLNTAKTIFTAIGLLIPPLVMIYRQPDLKNTITVMVLFCFMMWRITSLSPLNSGFRFSTGTCASACHYAGEFPASGGS